MNGQRALEFEVKVLVILYIPTGWQRDLDVFLGASPHPYCLCMRQEVLCLSGLSPTACPEAWISSNMKHFFGCVRAPD